MAEKRYSLSLEQLNNLVSDAVATAIRKLDNVEIIDDTAAEPEKGKAAIEVGEMDSKQYQEAMDTMARNRGAGDEPKVGIFWYNATRKELFGVVSHKRTDYLRPNAGGVFYQPADDQYIIAVGTWIDQSPEAIEQIIDEFDLPREKTIVKKAPHWDIGQTWSSTV